MMGKWRVFLFLVLLVGHPRIFAESETPNTISLASIVEHPIRSAPAMVLSLNKAPISAQLTAKVIATPVLVGNQVKQGDTLTELDCSDYKIADRIAGARAASVKSRAKLAENQLHRARKLIDQSLTSQDNLEEKQSNFAALSAEHRLQKAAIERAKLDVSRCKLKAPFSGVVTERHVSKGQLAKPGSLLVTLVDQEHIELSAQVNMSDAQYLLDAVSLNFVNSQSYPVTLRSLLPVVNPATRNREARFLFNDRKPLPGTSGKLVWKDSRTYLPAKYILQQKGQSGIFIWQDNQSVFMPIFGVQQGRSYPLDLPGETLLITDKQVLLHLQKNKSNH